MGGRADRVRIDAAGQGLVLRRGVPGSEEAARGRPGQHRAVRRGRLRAGRRASAAGWLRPVGPVGCPGTVTGAQAAVAAETPVLIVGGGPVGLALALDLGYRGVRSMLAERDPGT